MNAIISIVTIKAPWYAWDIALTRIFRKSQSKYAAVPGLLFKAYTISSTPEGKFFGGVYLWADEISSIKWFTPQWMRQIFATRGETPVLEHYTLSQVISFFPDDVEYTVFNQEAVAIVINRLLDYEITRYSEKIDGLFRIYEFFDSNFTNGLIMFFSSAEKATAFINTSSIDSFRLFKVPVLQDNSKVIA